MAKYDMQLNAFIPWSTLEKFAGIYKGDNRGFFSEGTSRIHFVGTYDTKTHKFTVDRNKTGCDSTYGNILFLGPNGEKTATLNNLVPTVINKGDSTKIDIHIQASNPLIPGSPPIDYKGDFTITQNLSTGQIQIASTLYGNGFPAVEAKITDENGQSIFLGGYSPENKGEVDRLIDGAIQNNLAGNTGIAVVNTGSVTINTDNSGDFLSIAGGVNLGVDKTDPLNLGKDPTNLVNIHSEESIQDWNKQLINATPIAGDVPYDLIHYTALDSSQPDGSQLQSHSIDSSQPDGSQLQSLPIDSSQPDGSQLQSLPIDSSQPDGSQLQSHSIDSSQPEHSQQSHSIDSSQPDGSQLQSHSIDSSQPDHSQQSHSIDSSQPDGSQLQSHSIDSSQPDHSQQSHSIDSSQPDGSQLQSHSIDSSQPDHSQQNHSVDHSQSDHSSDHF